ncbi:hypothetical protein AAVH_30417 [Aphelenchoides avenae]|nr:hypothetical protein AAVH_30417 [Aphelenchus avenae]
MEEVPGNAAAVANRIVVPNETLILILRWLHRFDLDGVQISTKGLRNLVDNIEMPLRHLDTVNYIRDAGDGDSLLSKNILLLQPNDYSRRKEQCPLDVEDCIDMARRYLTSVFIRILVVSDHRDRLPESALLTAYEERINCIVFERCTFNAPTNVRWYGRNDAHYVAPMGARFTALTYERPRGRDGDATSLPQRGHLLR